MGRVHLLGLGQYDAQEMRELLWGVRYLHHGASVARWIEIVGRGDRVREDWRLSSEEGAIDAEYRVLICDKNEVSILEPELLVAFECGEQLREGSMRRK